MRRRFLKHVCAWSLAAAMCIGNGVPAGAVSAEYGAENIESGSTGVLMTTQDGDVSTDPIKIDETNFPDANFRNYISTEIDGKMLENDTADEKLSADEIAEVENIFVEKLGITDLQGIQYFTSMTELYCSGNALTSLDVSGMTSLERLDCSSNQLTNLDVSGATALETLYCSSNQLTRLNLDGLTALTTLSCSKNNLSSLDISSLTALTSLKCTYNDSLSSLTTGALTNLETLECSENALTSLDVSGLTGLVTLKCDNNYLKSLDASKLTSLEILYCNNNEDLSSLIVAGLSSLRSLNCRDCYALKNLNVTGLTSLTYLNCHFNRLTTLDLSALTSLVEVDCSFNELSELKVANLEKLSKLCCENNALTVLDVSGLKAMTNLDCSSNKLTELNLADLTALNQLDCSGNRLTSLNVSAASEMQDLSCDAVSLTGLNLDEETSLSSVKIYTRGTRQYDLSKIPGLDTTKVADLEITNGTFSGTVLTINEDADEASFTYDCCDASAGYSNTVNFSILYQSPDDTDDGEDSGDDPELTEHHYSAAWTVDVAPTCTTKGSKSHHCTDDGCDSKSEVTEIPALGHTVTVETTPATMTADGSIVKKCSVCGTVVNRQVISRIDSVTLSKTSYTYTGKTQKPKVTVKDRQGTVISADCYAVKYSSGCKAIGKYAVSVTFKGNYSGSKSLTYTICPKATSISKISAKKKGFTLKWKKVTTQTTGYEIQYSTGKSFKNAGKLTVKQNKTTEKAISKLKAKKIYYVRIRTYKTVKINGKKQNIYSAWSKVKTVKTKK